MSYKCEILADSINEQGHRLTTFKVTYPRIIHAEMLRHRMLSRNVASSRAIPFEKMVKDVQENPFIPIAWQKNHSGMQGTEYLSKTDKFNLSQFVSAMIDTLNNMADKSSKDFKQFEKEVEERVNLITGLLSKYTHLTMTLDEWWLLARDKVVKAASILCVFRVTKQLCNRLLEPFVWTTELVSGTEWENFFELRCPQYGNDEHGYFKSKKDALRHLQEKGVDITNLLKSTDIEWQKINKSQAEIHIQKIAEMMLDAYNESKPKQLDAGEFHIPFGDRIDLISWLDIVNDDGHLDGDLDEQDRLFIIDKLKISTARCARLSYTTLGDNPKIDYEADIKLHDRLLKSKHLSCFEHCARAMSEEEYESFYKGERANKEDPELGENKGWCNNYRGFISYRYLVEN
jgi:thymidylate synthase ThyX